jgi:serine/threonine-protein kinase
VCLDENELADLVAHRLTGAALARALAHVESCAACRQAAAMLGALPEAPLRDRIGPGAMLERILLERIAGEGGTGVAWRGTREGQPVCVKILKHADEEARRRIVREARLAAAIDHPAIVAAKDVIADERGTPFALVFDWIEGTRLDEVLAEGAMPAERCARILVPLAEAIAAAHARGVVHRDLAPRNVILEAGDRPRLLDFGLARAVSSTLDVSTGLTRTGAPIGTPAYMSPEQTRGEPAGPAADVWALGAIGYEMLTGRRAIQGKSFAQVFRFHQTGSIAPLPGTTDVERAIMSALNPDASARPAAQHFVSLAKTGTTAG